jgi:hypothetical protein
MSAGDGVECFDLGMTLENQAASVQIAGLLSRPRRASSCGDAAHEPGLNRLPELAD